MDIELNRYTYKFKEYKRNLIVSKGELSLDCNVSQLCNVLSKCKSNLKDTITEQGRLKQDETFITLQKKQRTATSR